MSDYKSILKSNITSLDGSKIKKRDVKIKCKNSKAGELVISTISQNKSLFGGYTMKKIATGIDGKKDFTVQMEIRDGAQKFYDNVNEIINDPNVPLIEAEKSGFQNLAQQVKSTVSGVLSSVTGAAGVDSTAPAATSTETSAITPLEGAEESSSKMPLIIGGAVVLLLVIGLVIWKAKK